MEGSKKGVWGEEKKKEGREGVKEVERVERIEGREEWRCLIKLTSFLRKQNSPKVNSVEREILNSNFLEKSSGVYLRTYTLLTFLKSPVSYIFMRKFYYNFKKPGKLPSSVAQWLNTGP